MSEDQNIEYKESWRDEYLKWVCGFANANGGTIFIGIDDSGKVIGVHNIKKLMEDIPNKIQSGLGITVQVNRLSYNESEYIEIKVMPSSFPVSYHGEYYYRSGATKQQLTGNALSQFIMRKTGIRWEDEPVEGITVQDLDAESFRIFRREALRSKRMTETELNISDAELLSKLRLLSDGKLKRAAVLLFYNDPQTVQAGSYVKIGKFGSGADLQYQDVLSGSLISTADKVIDLIYLKYLKAKISYVHDRRVETYPFPREAIRESVYNALAHNCYMFGVPIQIRIEDEAIIISNRSILPDGWTAETLMNPHDSVPYNPAIANVFYRAGYIEAWGRGIQKICDACAQLGTEFPEYEITGTGLRVHFSALKKAIIDDSNGQKCQSDKISGALNDALTQKIIRELTANPYLTQKALSAQTGISRRTIQRKMNELSCSDILERTGSKRNGCWQIKKQIDIDDKSDKNTDILNDALTQMIINELTSAPGITQEELSIRIASSKRTVQRKMNELSDSGIIERIGSRRYGYWKIKKQINK